MKLHFKENKTAFETLINTISKQENIRPDIIEKDYYVTLILKELSEKQQNQNLPAYFKGGTALYKALKSIRRFSEDIDLTVYVENLTNNQKKKTLENSVKKYSSLKYERDEINMKGSITSNYLYETMFTLDEQDELQRFGKVKVEGTSYTISEPVTQLEVSPLLFEKAPSEFKEILKSQYSVAPFSLNVIALDRIFVDKIFASEFYFTRAISKDEDMFFDVAKHLYDLTVLLENQTIINSISDKERLSELISLKRKEEENRIGSDLSNKEFSNFEFFDKIKNNKAFESSYSTMQKIYVFNEVDRISLEEIYKTITTLKELVLKYQ